MIANLVLPGHVSKDAFSWTEIQPDPATATARNLGPPHFETLADRFVDFTVGGLVRWDAAHFLHVANNGYTFEHNSAFFPLYPLLVQFVAQAVQWLIGDFRVMTYISVLKVSWID